MRSICRECPTRPRTALRRQRGRRNSRDRLGAGAPGRAGGPGAGKSTLAAAVAARSAADFGVEAAVLPMDGFHYSRAALRAQMIEREEGIPFAVEILTLR